MMNRVCSPRLALLASTLTLLVAGCGGSGGLTGGLTCTPACPEGTHCADTGCVIDVAPLDLSVTGGDLTATCSPACSGSTPFCNSSHVCVACLADGDCPKGQACKVTGASSVCVQGCTDDSRCDAGQTCCNMQCTNTDTDVINCGTCGTVCGALHATPSCVGGACMAGACSAGWGNCNQDPKDGCEANLFVDINNCGGCGTTCKVANAVPGCSVGCYVAACKFGFDDCNGKPDDGCEVSVVSDAKNCGACGNVCTPPPHATASCLNASCQLTSCSAGYADCNGDAKDGCETSIFTDGKNCGACGASCPQGLVCKNGGCTCAQCNYPNATSICLNNVCSIDKCNNGWENCDGNAVNGCEVDLTQDPKNCGACGTVCPQNMQYCVKGGCTDVSPAVVYTGIFQQGQTPAQQCTDWKTFQGLLNMNNYNQITMTSDQDQVGVTCIGPEANTLCVALNKNQVAKVMCNGRTWQTGNCGNGLELSADGSTCACDNPGYIIRPCIGNLNWGGIKTNTCNAPGQTITISCSQ